MKKLQAFFAVAVAMTFLGSGCFRLAASKIPKDFSIQFESGACFGSCPVYKLSVSASGAATYEGISFVTTKGLQKATLTLEQIYALKQKVDHLGFFSLEDSYITDETGDLPRYKLTVTDTGRKKSITYNSKKELDELSELLAASILPEQWIAATPERCLEEYPSLRSNLETCRADLLVGSKNRDELIETVKAYRLEQSILKKLTALGDGEILPIWLVFLNHSDNASVQFVLEDFDHQKNNFSITRKIKNRTGKFTLNLISEKVSEKQSFPRGYFVTNAGGAMIDSYLLESDWTQGALSNVIWKDSETICSNQDCRTISQ